MRLIGPATGPLHRHSGLRGALEDLARLSDVVHVHSLWEDAQHEAARFCRAPGCRTSFLARDARPLEPCPKAIEEASLSRLAAAAKPRPGVGHPLHDRRRAARVCRPSASRRRGIVEPLRRRPEGVRSTPPPRLVSGEIPALANRPVVAFLGRIHPGKGLEYLVPAIAEVRGSEPALIVIGPDSGGHRPRSSGRSSDGGIADRVVFTGMLRGVERLAALADADLFCLPSDHENFGIAVMSARRGAAGDRLRPSGNPGK